MHQGDTAMDDIDVMSAPAPSPPTERAVRELARYRGAPAVTSLVVDIDGRRRPRRSDLAPVLGQLERAVLDQAGALGPDALAAAEADLARIQGWLAGDHDLRRLRALVLFSGATNGLFAPWGLAVPVVDDAVVDTVPALDQLWEALHRYPPAVVVLVDRRQSRFVRVHAGEATEIDGPIDVPPRRVDTDVELGSFERFTAEAARRHVRRVVDALARVVGPAPHERLVLSGPAEVVAEVRAELPIPMARLVAGVVGVPVTAPPADVAAAATGVLGAVRHQERSALLGDLAERAGRGSGARTGIDAVLAAVSDERVGVLFVRAGLHAPGARCSTCGRLVAGTAPPPACPRCGGRLAPVPDVVRHAVADVLAQGGGLEICTEPSLDDMGGIGAIERFTLHAQPATKEV